MDEWMFGSYSSGVSGKINFVEWQHFTWHKMLPDDTAEPFILR